MTRREKAEALFEEGYNCSQSVLLAFADLLPEDEETLAKLSSPFGGGMSRLRETCGAVSGMFMAAGYLYGFGTAETGEYKSKLYAAMQSLALRFEEKNGSLVCRELLGLSVKHDSPNATPRTADFYKTRPCKGFIGDAAEILEEFVNGTQCRSL